MLESGEPCWIKDGPGWPSGSGFVPLGDHGSGWTDWKESVKAQVWIVPVLYLKPDPAINWYISKPPKQVLYYLQLILP